MVRVAEAVDLIDFRFHLISLVAVFLALGLGILMGSVVLDQQLVSVLEGRVQRLQDQKGALQDDVISLERQLDADNRFADATEDWLLADALDGRDVVILRFEGTDDRVSDGAVDAIETAGGIVAATVTFTDRLALPGVVERDQLALTVESTSGRASELRSDAGDFIGTRLASAVTGGSREGRVDAADNAAVNLLLELEESGFVEVDGIEAEQRIPSADLLLLGGSDGERPFDLTNFTTSLAEAASARGAGFVVAESSESDWGIVGSILSHDVASEVATIDHAETVAGRIAVALALREAEAGTAGHYGIGPGAEEVIPRPSPEN